MATRTRQEYLKDLAENCVTTTPMESSTKFQLPLLGGKRKDKLKGAKGAELHSAGALVWAVTAAGDGTGEQKLPCLLAISAESVVLIERCSRKVVFNCCCRDVIGWKAGLDGGTRGEPYLDVFYERGQSVSVSLPDGQADDIKEIVQRLELETRGCEAREVTPLRNAVGQPGFLLSEEGFVVELQPFGYAESGGLRLGARVVRLCGRPLVSLDLEERANLMRTASRIHLTVIPPDENGKPRRSYSELRQRAIQDVECKAGEGPPAEAWVIDEREEEREAERERKQGEESEEKAEPVGNGKTRPGEGCDGSLLSPSNTPLLRAASLQDNTLAQPPDFAPSLTRCYSLEKHPPCQDSCDGHVYDNVWVSADRHIYENVGELKNATPDLILAVNPKIPLEEEEEEELQKQFVGLELSDQPSASDPSHRGTQPERVDGVDRSSRARSLQKSISKILSETPESTEEEWQSIAALDAACRGILAALSREDLKSGGGPEASSDCSSGMDKSDFKESDSSIHLEEKVSQLESMLKKLQDDLQKEKEDKAQLQAEVQSLRQNNQRLQEESQSTVARLIKVTELLCSVNKPC
ncbi:hypothetical protein MATL_G00053440 [Megalops atlanticus]|uniref:PDZ domain-containing protein n=1 Tax=Megalops atlanticus TaxID=7932 RepID=A0A9D3QAQ9_MEGAT|nr:hypothetical protein MATL_G00053440 [Megalops atlanticus]